MTATLTPSRTTPPEHGAAPSTLGSRLLERSTYLLIAILGIAGFAWPLLASDAATASGVLARADASLLAGAITGLVVVALALEVRRGQITAATIAVLGVLASLSGLLRLLDLPAGGSGIFFLVILAAAAYGPRFGTLLGLTSMSVSALLTAGVTPYLPFQMLGLAAMGAGAGWLGMLTQRAPRRVEVLALATYGWLWGFLYGAILNLSFWPFVRDGGALSYASGLTPAEVAERYWSFYVTTSLAWDAAGAIANVVLILLTATTVLRVLRRHTDRLDPTSRFVDAEPRC